MRVVVVYRPNTEHTQEVQGWLQELTFRTSKTLEEVNPDTRDGAAFCAVYDLTQYPSIIAIDHEGRVQNTWLGRPLPLIDEVSYYVG